VCSWPSAASVRTLRLVELGQHSDLGTVLLVGRSLEVHSFAAGTPVCWVETGDTEHPWKRLGLTWPR